MMDTAMERRGLRRHAIAPRVRVRKEAFGLLFYNKEESRLTFVKSGDLLNIKTLPGGEKTIEADLKPGTQMKVRKLLDHLIKKRLICEA
jgi:putative mycofactocin binding protein MftB